MTTLPAGGPAPDDAGPRPPLYSAPLGYLVPPALQDDICRAFGVEPWQVGLAPAPPLTRWQRWTRPLRRAWLKITRRW